jgi:hypothetical protein
MNPSTAKAAAPGGTPPHPEVRAKVRDLLLKSPAFRALAADQQQQIARHTVEVCDYLARPEGIEGHRLSGRPAAKSLAADPFALQLASTSNVQDTGGKFQAQGARQGAEVAGLLLEKVNFPNFVSGLIEGVFHAIVKSSIEQMQAYGELVANVSKTLNQFRDDNVTANQGRDHLVEQFPDTFQIDVDTGEDGGPSPRVRLRDGADEDAALKKVNNLPIEGGPISSLDDDTLEDKVVPAARTQLASSRQQLLATMVLMGINRIVVTDGKISAKVMYDFKAKDNFKGKYSATKFDYGDQYTTVHEGEQESSTQGAEHTRTTGDKGTSNEDIRDASYYTKGKYKDTSTPVMTLASATQETTDASLSTKASLAGVVEVNFKSDYLPLEKMADSFQIARIQDASKPKSAQAGRGAAAGTAPAGGAPAAGTPPADQSAPPAAPAAKP